MADNAGTNDSILKRIQALLAKTESNGATTAEAVAAAAKTQELLIKYKLNMLDVSSAESRIIARMPVIERYFDSDIKGWRSVLLNTITKCMFTQAIKYSDTRYSVIGKEGEIEVAVALYTWVAEQMSKLCERDFLIREIEYIQNNGALMPKPTKKQSVEWHESWFYGANQTVGIELRKYLSRPEVQALVVTNKEEIDSFLQKRFGGNLRSVSVRQKNVDYDAVVRGQQAGRRVNFGDRPEPIGTGNGQLGSGR